MLKNLLYNSMRCGHVPVCYVHMCSRSGLPVSANLMSTSARDPLFYVPLENQCHLLA